MKAIIVLALSLAAIFSASSAFGAEPNPVTEKFIDGCHLAAQSTDALRDAFRAAPSDRKVYALMCVTATSTALQIAKSAHRFSYFGLHACVPPSANLVQVMHNVVSLSARMDSAKQQSPDDLVILAIVDLYECDG